MTTMTDSKALNLLAQLMTAENQHTHHEAFSHIAARLREPAGVGGEWVLVPRVPTRTMLQAGVNAGVAARGPWCPKVWTAMLAAAPQPPAEAQAKGGGEVCIAAHWLENVAAAASLLEASGDVFNVREAAALRKLIASAKDTAPPSAPVGVEAADDGIGEYHIDGVHFDIPGQWTRVALRRAAAQGGGFRLDASGRPVSVDAPVRVEDLMTVYATAFNRCSLDPDDRFSPAFRGIEAVMRALAQQPAAVECDCPSGRVDHASWCAVSKAQDTAIAAQPGGSDSDR